MDKNRCRYCFGTIGEDGICKCCKRDIKAQGNGRVAAEIKLSVENTEEEQATITYKTKNAAIDSTLKVLFSYFYKDEQQYLSLLDIIPRKALAKMELQSKFEAISLKKHIEQALAESLVSAIMEITDGDEKARIKHINKVIKCGPLAWSNSNSTIRYITIMLYSEAVAMNCDSNYRYSLPAYLSEYDALTNEVISYLRSICVGKKEDTYTNLAKAIENSEMAEAKRKEEERILAEYEANKDKIEGKALLRKLVGDVNEANIMLNNVLTDVNELKYKYKPDLNRIKRSIATRYSDISGYLDNAEKLIVEDKMNISHDMKKKITALNKWISDITDGLHLIECLDNDIYKIINRETSSKKIGEQIERIIKATYDFEDYRKIFTAEEKKVDGVKKKFSELLELSSHLELSAQQKLDIEKEEADRRYREYIAAEKEKAEHMKAKEEDIKLRRAALQDDEKYRYSDRWSVGQSMSDIYNAYVESIQNDWG